MANAVHSRVHVSKKKGVNVLILARWWAGQSSCVFAEDFHTSLEIITAEIALGNRTAEWPASSFFFSARFMDTHNMLTAADILWLDQVLAAFLASSLQMMFRYQRDVRDLLPSSCCFVFQLFWAHVFVFVMRPPP